jgi:hypothetical protein
MLAAEIKLSDYITMALKSFMEIPGLICRTIEKRST